MVKETRSFTMGQRKAAYQNICISVLMSFSMLIVLVMFFTFSLVIFESNQFPRDYVYLVFQFLFILASQLSLVIVPYIDLLYYVVRQLVFVSKIRYIIVVACVSTFVRNVTSSVGLLIFLFITIPLATFRMNPGQSALL